MSADSAYPTGDLPDTFDFNGVPMPAFAACWAWARLCARAESAMDEDDEVSAGDLRTVARRIDHVGVVESADPAVFRVVAAQLILASLTDEPQVVDAVIQCSSATDRRGLTPAEIVANIRSGLFNAIRLVDEDGLAFWTSGYDRDAAGLREAMRRHQLPIDDPDHLVAPHVVQALSRRDGQYAELRGQLLRRLHAGGLPKELREQIHGLPKRLRTPG